MPGSWHKFPMTDIIEFLSHRRGRPVYRSYITAAIVASKDPETGIPDIGHYCFEVIGKQTVSFRYTEPSLWWSGR